MRRLASKLIASTALAVASTPCDAQQTEVVLKPRTDTPRAESVWVRLQAWVPGGRRGGYGWITVDVDNRHEETHEVELIAADARTAGDRIHVRRSLPLEPLTSRRITLPIPCAGLGQTLRVDLDGRVDTEMTIAPTPGAGVALLRIGLQREAEGAWSGIGAFGGAAYRRSGVRSLECDVDDLPAGWPALTAFDVVVVDGTSAGLTPPVQSLLVDYVAGGGRLVLIAPERLLRAPLRDLVDGSEPAVVPHGFGAVATYPLDAPASEAAGRANALRQWLTSGAFDVGPWLADSTSGPVPSRFHVPARIPGISGVPTNLFFLVIVLFVLLVGPVNHIWFRRQGRAWVVLLTVPIAGFLVTGLILGYSVLREGLGMQGVITTASFLDQRQHRVAGFGSRTVFAGISPAELRPKAATYLFTHDVLAADRTDDAVARLALDAAAGTIDGALVPSRRPTGLVNVSTGPCRERIRFRRREDRSLEVLDSDELSVVRRTDALVLHDFDGDWHTMRSDGIMLPLAERDGMRTALSLLPAFERAAPDPTHRPTAVSYGILADEWIRTRLLSHLREPGTYCAFVRSARWLDDLELDVAWSDEVHLVVGILAPEDIVE